MGAMPSNRPAATNQSLLSGLPEHLSAKLFNAATPVKLTADETLFMAGDAGDGCYRVKEGLLKVTMVSRAGSERILAFLGPGAMVGELVDHRRAAALGIGRGRARRAVEFSQPRRIRGVRQGAPRSLQIPGDAACRAAARNRRGDRRGKLPAAARPRRLTLLELAQEFGQDVGAGRIVIRQKIGQSDLAAMAGIARENVSRILNDWKRRKLVSRLSGYYCLENKSQLEHEAEL